MKNLYFSVIFLFSISFNSFAQITIVSGVPSPYHQTITNGQTYTIGIPLGTSIPTPDIGTNVYKVDNANVGCIPDYFIVRVGGIWKIGLSGCLNIIAYQYHTTSTEIDPPCTGLWLRIGGVGFPGGTVPSGFVDNLTLTGSTCSPGTMPFGCSTLSCQFLQLPQLNSAAVSAIPSPQQGMLSFNSELNALTWFDGYNWKNVYNGLGDFSVGGNLNALNNINVSGSLITNGLSTFNSGIRYPINTTSTPIFLTDLNYVVLFTAPTSCSYPTAFASNKGQVYKLINHSSGVVSLSPSVKTGSATTTNSLSAGTSIEIISDGTDWRKLN